MAGQSNLVSAHINKEKYWKHTECLQGFSGSNSCYRGLVRLYGTVHCVVKANTTYTSWFKQKIKPVFKHWHLVLMNQGLQQGPESKPCIPSKPHSVWFGWHNGARPQSKRSVAFIEWFRTSYTLLGLRRLGSCSVSYFGDQQWCFQPCHVYLN